MVSAGVNIIPEVSVTEVVALAVEAERLGYDRCWVYDEGLVTRDVYVTLTAIAVATSRLTLGPGITNPYTRHPGVTAAAIASLDELSGGRAFLGIGAGGSLTLDPLGIARHRPLGAVRDTITSCRGLFAGAPVEIDNDQFRLRSAVLGFPARAETEIWLAGRGPKMLELGGATCDGVMLDFIFKPSLGDAIARVRSGGAAAISYSTMIITDDTPLSVAKPHLTYRLVDSPPEVKSALGITDAASNKIRSAMAGGLHAAAEFVDDDWVEPFVITGSRDACRTEIGNIVDRYGIAEFLLPVLDFDHAVGDITAAAAVLS